ncbi:hypothetical protein AB7828_02285 [Tardiphaga sp. 215_C5_N2_1]|uniref:hypothetical protein n=1 Tax=Tardiphaga sp. 215_C5_N2_1 TaxID=3240774 RepID=UPI003F8C8DDA
MFMKQIAVVGAVLVLGGYLAASDGALAEGQGGLGHRPSQTVKNGTPNLAGPQTKSPSNSLSGSTIRNGSSASGPYKPVLGYKW